MGWLLQRHEPDPALRTQWCLSFEGFARYMMDKDNYAFPNEYALPDENEMKQPMSQYYIASSHNTYLTGHQLKGESSVQLYSQVKLSLPLCSQLRVRACVCVQRVVEQRHIRCYSCVRLISHRPTCTSTRVCLRGGAATVAQLPCQVLMHILILEKLGLCDAIAHARSQA